MNQLEQKEVSLKEYLSTFERLAVAFSAGVDSALLLKEAKEVLGDRVMAMTARIHSFPERELSEAKAFCEKENIRHIIVEIDELEIPGFKKNPENRCYLCKRALFSKMKEVTC